MEAGLTLSVLLFLLLVYLPGSLATAVAGRKREERTVAATVFYGTLVLVLSLSLLYALALAKKSDVLERFVSSLAAAASGKPVDLRAVGGVFALTYFASSAVGLAELFFLSGLVAPPGWMRRCFAWRPVRRTVRFCERQRERLLSLIAERQQGARVRPGDQFLGIFVRFRRAGKRPLVKITFADGTQYSGECLSYSWNGKESVFLRNLDDPRKVSHVVLEGARTVEFLNFAEIESARAGARTKEELEEYLSDLRKNRYILNGISYGYGDELYGDLIQKIEKKLEELG
ncbi:hypothetical protein EDD75_0388 [Thermodesulfitimonas autotrophica]|uniref:Uncharacterized protein n=1 Tax=Thermodesulfitimonas autotrophica TaxID=1894989 RepID=A0A3N5C094_9THEO|nr:hypothetical protein [Thermodesulfitimonas autotrophica]RPF49571.1 hypothetical protein EDD75_0388 [Thermodesulfitimonas autotrophica]